MIIEQRTLTLSLIAFSITICVHGETVKTIGNPWTGKPDYITVMSSSSLTSGSTQYIQNSLTPTTTSQTFSAATGIFAGSSLTSTTTVNGIDAQIQKTAGARYYTIEASTSNFTSGSYAKLKLGNSGFTPNGQASAVLSTVDGPSSTSGTLTVQQGIMTFADQNAEGVTYAGGNLNIAASSVRPSLTFQASGGTLGFQTPAGLASSVTWQLPTADSSGCFKSDGSGNMSIASCVGINNQDTLQLGSTFYTSSGTVSGVLTAKRDDQGLTFNPLDALVVANSSASTNANQYQASPGLRLESHAWNTGSSADNRLDIRHFILGQPGSPPYAIYRVDAQVNGGGYYTMTDFRGTGSFLFSGPSTNAQITMGLTGVNASLQLDTRDAASTSSSIDFKVQGIEIGLFQVASHTMSFDGAAGTALRFRSNSTKEAFFADNSGNVNMGLITTSGAKLQINTPDSSTKGLLIKGSASQSANLTEWQNSSSVILASVTASGVFTGDGSGLTNLQFPAVFTGSLFIGLTSGTTFQSFVPLKAITIKNITYTADVASAGGSGDTFVCGDDSGHSISVVSANAAAAGTLTSNTGTANITAGTTVYMRMDSGAVTKSQGNLSCGYFMQ